MSQKVKRVYLLNRQVRVALTREMSLVQTHTIMLHKFTFHTLQGTGCSVIIIFITPYHQVVGRVDPWLLARLHTELHSKKICQLPLVSK